MLENILPLYDTVEREHSLNHAAETYNVEVADSINLDDSIFLAKRSIKDFFIDLLREKRGFKYNLATIITLQRWNNAVNSYDIEAIYIKTKANIVIR